MAPSPDDGKLIDNVLHASRYHETLHLTVRSVAPLGKPGWMISLR